MLCFIAVMRMGGNEGWKYLKEAIDCWWTKRERELWYSSSRSKGDRTPSRVLVSHTVQVGAFSNLRLNPSH